LLERLAKDERLKLSRADLDAAVAEPLSFAGAAAAQVDAVVRRVEEVARRHPQAAVYEPEPIF